MFQGMPSEASAIAAVAAPATMANSEKVTGAADAASYASFRAVLLLGDMASETIDFRIECADDSGFSNNKTTVVSSTQLAAHATNNDSKALVLECRDRDIIKASATARYVRARGITGGGTGGPAAILLEGFGARKQPVTNNTAVLEVKRP
mgnify:CR=1 FL=1